MTNKKYQKIMHVRLTLTEEMLGTNPGDEEVYDRFIASNAPDAPTRQEEIEAFGIGDVADKGRTVFPTLEDGTPYMWNYQIKGMFKDSCGMLNRLAGKDPETGKKIPANASSKIKAYKKEIDGLIFVKPRKIPIRFVGGVGDCQRPLRAQTAQGERVTLASSDTVPAGATIEFFVCLKSAAHEEAIREWLDYGEDRGLGQWRNSGKGTFLWEELDDYGNVIGGNYEELREMYF